MNRFVVFGVAVFFAIVGLALVGGEESANAGLFRHGCSGCDGGSDCGGGGLFGGRKDCCGREKKERCCGREKCSGGLFSRLKSKKCCGEAPACCEAGCEAAAPSCAGEVAPSCAGEAAPAPAPAPEAPKAPEAEKKAA